MSNFDYLMGGIIICTVAVILHLFLTILIRGRVIQISKQIDFLYKREVRLKRQQEVYQEKKEKEREAEAFKLRRERAKR